MGTAPHDVAAGLLVALEFEHLAREQKAKAKKVEKRKPAPGKAAAAVAAPAAGPEEKDKKQEAFDLVLATTEALSAERNADEKIWGSMVAQALKRRNPGFSASYYGFRSFNQLLEEAATRRLLELERDEKSGGYIVRSVAQ